MDSVVFVGDVLQGAPTLIQLDQVVGLSTKDRTSLATESANDGTRGVL